MAKRRVYDDEGHAQFVTFSCYRRRRLLDDDRGRQVVVSVLGEELIMVARRGLDNLPERQRVVVTMRDMLGLDSDEVCELLEISAANQRVLLHRGRAAVRQVLEDYLRDTA